jgi:hypothetical protein
VLGEWFFADDPAWNAREVSCDGEIKTEAELRVEMPSRNLGFNQLARAAMQNLPRDPGWAAREPALARGRLREVVCFRNAGGAATKTLSETRTGGQARFWQVRVGESWTVPVVELAPSVAKGVTLILADAGRGSLAREAAGLIAAGQRVLALDVYGFGETRIVAGRGRKDYALLMAAVGERPLGVQAGQLAAVAKWARVSFGGPVSLRAVGPRTSLIALVTAALEREASDGLELRGAMGSLKELIEENAGADERPEQFCFGLLEAFDLPQLRVLAGESDEVRPSQSR